MWTVWGKTSPNSLIAYLPWWPFMHALVNIHILQGKGGGEECSLNSPLRWPWSRSIWIFQEISSQVYFNNDGWVGSATQETGNILGCRLLTRTSFPLRLSLQGGREKQSCLDLEVPTLEGCASKEAITKRVAMKGMLIWYFLRHVGLMNIKREIKSPSKQMYRWSGALTQEQGWQNNGIKTNLCSALFILRLWGPYVSQTN